jgi:hypothetical protein
LQVATNNRCKFGVQVMLIAADRPRIGLQSN